jgi:hydroxypyruvate reductase
MHAEQLLTHSLRTMPHGGALAEVMAAALRAVEPAGAVRTMLRRDGATLHVGEHRYDLGTLKRVLLVGAGKAGTPMAQAAAAVLADRLSAGLVIVKDGYAGDAPPNVEIVEAGHPLPDRRGVEAATRLLHLVDGAGEGDLVLVLLSGGGSALLTLPAQRISLDDMIAMTDVLLRCGATINEINTLRKQASQIGGGRLAQRAAPAQIATLILSDVVGSPLDVIASGPTVPDPTTFADAWAVVERYGLQTQLPASIMAHLQRGLAGNVPSTPKADDPCFRRTTNVVVGSNAVAAQAATEAAAQRGFNTLLLTTYLQGEARQIGEVLAAVAHEIALHDRPIAKPALLVAGGETTVTLRGDGAGGRNQELALGAVQALAGLPDTTLVALATDGGDGPTDAAGAVATGETLARAQAQHIDPHTFLMRNDAYHFWEALDDLLLPGPTLTNVNDLVFVAVGTL